MTNITNAIWIGFLAAAGSQAWAVTPITSCPFVISAPGNYVVTTDLRCLPTTEPSLNNVGIKITASNVTLNLNGHILTGFVETMLDGMYVTGTGIAVVGEEFGTHLDHVGISGPGLVQNFGTGIAVKYSDFVQVNGVTVVAGPLADFSTLGVFALKVKQLSVSNNVIARASEGLFLDIASGASITGNQVVGNASGIVVQSGSDAVISNNVVGGNASAGITVAVASPVVINSRVSANTVIGNGFGIAVGSGAQDYKIFNNTSVGNTGTQDTQGFDIFDVHGCSLKRWSDNVFFTSNLPCVP